MAKIQRYCLFGILIFGLGLRCFSLNSGLPYLFGPDEIRQVLDALSMPARRSIIPLDLTYPALHKYLLLCSFGVYFGIGLILKTFVGVGDFVFKFLVDPGGVFLVARGMSVFFAMLLMIPVYSTAKLIGSRESAVIACLFSTFMFSLVAHSQWATADSLLAFLSAAAFFYIIKCAQERRYKNFVLCGILMGLACATKYQGVYLLVPFLAMSAICLFKNTNRKHLGILIVTGLIVTSIVAMLGNLGFVFEFKGSIQRLFELKDERMGISSLLPFSQSYLSVVAWFIKELLRQELILGVFLLLGVAYALYKHSRNDLIFLSYIWFCLFSLVGFGFRSLHILVYAFPVLCVFGAHLLVKAFRMINNDRHVFGLSFIAASIIVMPNISNAVVWDIKRSNPDTRILAKQWVEKNIGFGTKISEDWFDLSVPLQSNVPLLFRDDKLKPYYFSLFDGAFRQKYADYISRIGAYDLVQVRYETNEPKWPKNMPEEAFVRAQNIPLMKRLYRWFNFKTISELKQEGVSYIIISSYAYNHFLLDTDLRKKTGLFNPYMLEDTLSSNRQAQRYQKDNKYGLLFFLAERARGFYLPLLDLETKDVELVYRIFPQEWNTGPVISIYQLK